MKAFTIVETIRTTAPEKAALAFGAILAVDKGVGNIVEPYAGGFLMLAEDGKAILFLPKGRERKTARRVLSPIVRLALFWFRAEKHRGLTRERLDSLVSHFGTTYAIGAEHLAGLQRDAWEAFQKGER